MRMDEIKQLLVATDFSHTASHAIERAVLLAKRNHARLDIIHIATPGFLGRLLNASGESLEKSRDDHLEKSRRQLEELAASILASHGLACETHLVVGSLINELAAHAKARAADVVVVGFCGTSLLRHFLMGSTSERLITSPPCHILVVKNPPHSQYRSALMTVDLSPISSKVLKNARTIAPEADLTLLHVYSSPLEGKLHYAGVSKDTISQFRAPSRQQALQQMKLLSNTAGIKEKEIRLLAIHGTAPHRIISQEALRNHDLIVMGKQGESLLDNLFIGSVTRHVVSRSKCDVLVTV